MAEGDVATISFRQGARLLVAGDIPELDVGVGARGSQVHAVRAEGNAIDVRHCAP